MELEYIVVLSQVATTGDYIAGVSFLLNIALVFWIRNLDKRQKTSDDVVQAQADINKSVQDLQNQNAEMRTLVNSVKEDVTEFRASVKDLSGTLTELALKDAEREGRIKMLAELMPPPTRRK